MRHGIFTVAALGVWALAGCGPQVGFLVRPIPVDQRLTETVISQDPGLFVSDKIAVLDVDGLILNRRATGLLSGGENPVSLFVETVDRIAADRNVRAVVVRINSPGGGVTASDILHRHLLELRRTRKIPVIAAIEDLGASGAYYTACAADTIIVHPTSLVGFIGVIVQTMSFSGTMKMLGIRAQAVTSGEYKDMASPFKPLDKKDLAVLQSIVDSYYRRFVGVVEAGRKGLSAEKVRKLGDGRVYAAQQALANGLVDRIGYIDDAIALAKERCGSSRVKVVVYHRPWGYRPNAYAMSAQAPRASGGPATTVNLLNLNMPDLSGLSQPRFLYLWTGSSFARR